MRLFLLFFSVRASSPCRTASSLSCFFFSFFLAVSSAVTCFVFFCCGFHLLSIAHQQFLLFRSLRSLSPSATAPVTKSKILSMDFEASSLEGITKSTSLDQNWYQPLQKLESLVFVLLLRQCVHEWYPQ